jgi:hypothetical protein
MNNTDDELLSQHIDGELSELESAAILKRLKQEPELAKRLDSLSRVDRMLKDTYANTNIDLPEHLIDMLQAEHTNVVPLRGNHRPVWLTAVAASILVAVGFLVGQQWRHEQSLPLLLPSAVAVSGILESHPSSLDNWINLEAGLQLRPVLSFVEKSGTYCREYELAGNGQGWRGVACRVQGQWQTQLLVNVEDTTASTDQYRTAGALNAEIINSFVKQRIQDIPMGAEEEAAHISGGWR